MSKKRFIPIYILVYLKDIFLPNVPPFREVSRVTLAAITFYILEFLFRYFV